MTSKDPPPKQHSTKRFPWSIVKQLSGLVPFETTVTEDEGGGERAKPWERCDK